MKLSRTLFSISLYITGGLGLIVLGQALNNSLFLLAGVLNLIAIPWVVFKLKWIL